MLGLSQEKLADSLGITFQQVQKYEKGTNRMGASRLFDIARVLDARIDYFFDGLPIEGGAQSQPGFGEGDNSSYVVDYLSTTEGINLNRAFVKIKDPQVRRKIIELVRTLGEPDAEGSN